MRKICILTDSSAQFPAHAFPGEKFVRIIPFDLELNGVVHSECQSVKINDFPPSTLRNGQVHLIAPPVERYEAYYRAISKEFDQIIVLTQSELLSQSFTNALQAADIDKGKFNLLILNSQTTSVGLGALTQAAAAEIEQGKSMAEVEHFIRHQIPHIYALFCTSGLSYLTDAHLIDPAQALVGEMLNFLTVYTLEAEQLTPLEKIRNLRNLPDLFLEFLEEFDQLRHIGLVHSLNSTNSETRSVKQSVQELYPQSSYTEHALNVPLAAQFGPRTIGIIAVEAV